jgi:hypothetical protein
MSTFGTIIILWWISAVFMFTLNIWPSRDFCLLEKKIEKPGFVSADSLQVRNLGRIQGLGLSVLGPLTVFGLDIGSVLSYNRIDWPTVANQVLTFDGSKVGWQVLKPQALTVISPTYIVIGSTSRRETPRRVFGAMSLSTNGATTLAPLSVNTGAFAFRSVQTRHWRANDVANSSILVTDTGGFAVWRQEASVLRERNIVPDLGPAVVNQVAPFNNHAFAFTLNRDGQEMRLFAYGRVLNDASARFGIFVLQGSTELANFLSPISSSTIHTFDWSLTVHVCRRQRGAAMVWVVCTQGQSKQVIMNELETDLENVIHLGIHSFSSMTAQVVECTFSEAKIIG